MGVRLNGFIESGIVRCGLSCAPLGGKSLLVLARVAVSEDLIQPPGTSMSFATNDVIEIEASQYRAVARVRNVMGGRMHVAFETGYVPWSDDPILVRRYGESAESAVDARILHASGPTAMIELLQVTPTNSSDRLVPVRDTMTDEA